MRRSLWIAGLCLICAGQLLATQVRDFGQPLTAGLEPTPIEQIVADPDAWVGKKVQIEGRVSGVCQHQGCWMDLVSPADTTLRVKVDDGVIVFPADAVGLAATAEGTVEILEMNRDQYESWLRYQAEEAGSEVAPEMPAEGPYRVVRLRGAGATVTGP